MTQFQKVVNGFIITVPSRRNYILSILMVPFILCWAFVELIVLPMLLYNNPADFASPVGIFWLAGWTFMGLLLIKLFLWQSIGKTILKFERNILTIQKKWDIFYKSKSFDLNNVKNVRIVNRDIETFGYYTRVNYLFTNKTKSIEFNYGNKNIRMVDWLEIEDATNILRELKRKNIFAEENYAQHEL